LPAPASKPKQCTGKSLLQFGAGKNQLTDSGVEHKKVLGSTSFDDHEVAIINQNDAGRIKLPKR